MKKWLTQAWKDNKSLVLFIVLMFVFRSALADWNDVPTGSMKPTILEGDRILVNKVAYDLRVPFTDISMYRHADPQHGDIVVIDSEVMDKRLVKRVIGIPGDTVALRNNVLFINGQPLSYQNVRSDPATIDRSENLLGVEHLVRINRTGSQLSSFFPVRVPPEQYLVLGDNRDDSADSRVMGLVPRDEIVGRSKRVAFSLNYENFYLPRTDRFLHPL